MAKLTQADLVEVEIYATLIAASVCTYEEIALGKAEYRNQRIGVDANAPNRADMLRAVRAAAVAKGYDGPALPEGEINLALRRRSLLTDLLDGEPKGESWLDQRDFFDRAMVDIDLNDHAAIQRLREVYRPPAQDAPPAPAADPATTVHPWTPTKATSAATMNCARGAHRFGAANQQGCRTCDACGVVCAIPDDNPGAVIIEDPRPINIT